MKKQVAEIEDEIRRLNKIFQSQEKIMINMEDCVTNLNEKLKDLKDQLNEEGKNNG